jgi:hypothetical protein
MMGKPPSSILIRGKSSSKYFMKTVDRVTSKATFELKTLAQYSVDQGARQKPGKKYFKYNTLEENVMKYPFSSSLRGEALEKEKTQRAIFVDFLKGVLNVDYRKRWAASQAILHPFLTGEPFDPSKPFIPPPLEVASPPASPSTSRPVSKLNLADVKQTLLKTPPQLPPGLLGTSPSTSLLHSITQSMGSMSLSTSAPNNLTPTPIQLPSGKLIPPAESNLAVLGISPSAGGSPYIRSDLPSSGAAVGISIPPGPGLPGPPPAGSFGLGVSPSQKSPYFPHQLPPGASSSTFTSPYRQTLTSSKTSVEPKPTPSKSPTRGSGQDGDDGDIFPFE